MSFYILLEDLTNKQQVVINNTPIPADDIHEQLEKTYQMIKKRDDNDFSYTLEETQSHITAHISQKVTSNSQGWLWNSNAVVNQDIYLLKALPYEPIQNFVPEVYTNVNCDTNVNCNISTLSDVYPIQPEPAVCKAPPYSSTIFSNGYSNNIMFPVSNNIFSQELKQVLSLPNRGLRVRNGQLC
jgi:hypothetical protein